jgi:subtilisin family serine protease
MLKYSALLWIVALSALLFHSPCTADTILYLKWSEELSPHRAVDRWETGARDLDEVLRRFDLLMVQRVNNDRRHSTPVGLQRVLRLTVSPHTDTPALLRALRDLPGTEYAVENPLRVTSPDKESQAGFYLDNVPGDPLYGEQWFYPVLQAPAAWDLTRGGGSVVAIVDNGTDWQHPDLAGNIWSNPGEIPGNGVDDDQNGFVDDIRGWDFFDQDNNPSPETFGGTVDYHGTHTAGLAAALMNNRRGVVGMAPECKIMPIRVGIGSTIVYGLEGIIYAAQNGADVISLSWGGPGSNSFESDVIADAMLQGAVVIAAAGNEGTSSPHYPAAYSNVLAVAATAPGDVRSGFSNYGDWVSLCAPGTNILSLIPSGYGTANGTSMSTPLVAGVAALIKSLHPDWTPQQIFTQIVFTADNIDYFNPLYIGLLGSGRLNAYRAVTETAPGMRIENLAVLEVNGDGDGRLDPGETGNLILSLKNFGASTANIQTALTSANTDLVILQGNWNLAQLNASAVADNAANPFTVFISPTAPPNTPAALTFTINAEDFYSAILTSTLWIDPSFADHDTGDVIFTITDFGAFGFRNYTQPGTASPGSGFRYPKDGSNALYHGSFLAGVAAGKVSDCAYGGSYVQRYDWQTTANGEITIGPGEQADQEGLAVYADTKPPSAEQVGLEVTQHSYAWNTPDADAFVILAFEMKNVTGGPLNPLYAALYCDWDVAYYDSNRADWSADDNLGYVFNPLALSPNKRYYGTSLLSGSPASYRVIDNANDLPPGPVYPWMSDSMKWDFMTSGMVKTSGVNLSDYATLLTAGPFDLPAGASITVAFAVLGGANLPDLQSHAAAALARWNNLQTSFENGSETSGGFEILDVFPKPANPEINLTFYLPAAGPVQFELLDITGRIVLRNRILYTSSGIHNARIHSAEFASGIYFLRGTTAHGQSISKVIILK